MPERRDDGDLLRKIRERRVRNEQKREARQECANDEDDAKSA